MRTIALLLASVNVLVLVASPILSIPDSRKEGPGHGTLVTGGISGALILVSETPDAVSKPEGPVTGDTSKPVKSVSAALPGMGTDAVPIVADALMPGIATALPGPSVLGPAEPDPVLLGENAREQSSSPTASNMDTMGCFRVGPVSTKAAAVKLREHFPATESDTGIEEATLPAGTTYWVHVVPQASAREAQAVVRALLEKKIDSFVINDPGPLRNGVSLGVFRDAGSADRFQSSLQGIGYAVRTRKQSAASKQYYVRVNAPRDYVVGIVRGGDGAPSESEPRISACSDESIAHPPTHG